MEFFKNALTFIKEAYNELRKVSWLSRKEVLGSTVVITIFIFAVAVYISFVDFLLSRLFGIILQR